MSDNLAAILGELEQLIASRAKDGGDDSYTVNYYPARGYLAQKIIEEAGETALAAKAGCRKNDRRIGGSFFSLPCRHESL